MIKSYEVLVNVKSTEKQNVQGTLKYDMIFEDDNLMIIDYNLNRYKNFDLNDYPRYEYGKEEQFIYSILNWVGIGGVICTNVIIKQFDMETCEYIY